MVSRNQLADRLLELVAAGLERVDRTHVVLQRRLRAAAEIMGAQPAVMPGAPGAVRVLIDDSVAQQQLRQSLPGARPTRPDVLFGILAER
jgi:hypothetical protein